MSFDFQLYLSLCLHSSVFDKKTLTLSDSLVAMVERDYYIKIKFRSFEKTLQLRNFACLA